MKYGLIGEKLSHSFSKEIHESLADYTYEICELTPDEVAPFLEAREFEGINVTIPYKEKVIPYLDSVSDAAKKIGAVNTIKKIDGKLIGIIGLQSKFHTPAYLDGRVGQLIVVIAVNLLVKDPFLLLDVHKIIRVIRKADLPQAHFFSRFDDVRRVFLAVEADPGMHMVIKHFLYPPRIDGTPLAAPLSR